MGRVYLAEDLVLERPVAIKVLLESLVQDSSVDSRFLREAKAMASVEHPNVVRVYACGQSEAGTYLVMEYVDGTSLDSRLVRDGFLDEHEALRIIRQAIHALDAGWRKGLIHRDIKPSNILLDDKGQVRLTDFGLARSVNVDRSRENQMQAVRGTPHYMSPEQARGEPITDFRNDVYSLGIVLYELLTGTRPFEGKDLVAVVNQQLHAELPPLESRRSGLSAGVVELCEWMTEKEPAARPESYGQLGKKIEDLLTESAHLARGVHRARSIAVLPMTDLSREKDQEYFCDGIAEEIINALVKIEDLSVASRISSFQFKDVVCDISEIGRRLSVDSVLEGSVRKEGNTLRITTQLIDAATGYHLWSERYDREIGDVFAVQDEITESVVDALAGSLRSQDQGAIQRLHTRNVEAYDFYLRGRNYFWGLTGRSLEMARQMMTRATEIDPDYALAFAGLADCFSVLLMYFEEGQAELLEKGIRASTRALELGPDLAEAHVSRGLVLDLAGQHNESGKHFQTAIRLSPGLFDAHYLYGRACLSQGNMEKAGRCFEKAAAIRPDSYLPLQLLRMVYEGIGQPAEAEAAARRALTLIERTLEINPDDIRALYTGAQNAARVGENDLGSEWAQHARALAADDVAVLYNLACFYSLAGDLEEAMDLFAESVVKGYAHRSWAEYDSDLDPIRDHPRFDETFQKIP